MDGHPRGYPGRPFHGRALGHLHAAPCRTVEPGGATAGDYVQIAARLAADLPRLTAMRADLRDQVAQSPLCDHRRRAKQLDRVFKYMWRVWCAQD